MTPLHYAIENHKIKCATMLLGHQADWRIEDTIEGKNALAGATEAELEQLKPFL